jgi:hypothetical protein
VVPGTIWDSLALNIIVLWNALYINATLDQLRAEGFPVRPEDIARLSPLEFETHQFIGQVCISVPETVQRGEIAPAQKPVRLDGGRGLNP